MLTTIHVNDAEVLIFLCQYCKLHDACMNSGMDYCNGGLVINHERHPKINVQLFTIMIMTHYVAASRKPNLHLCKNFKPVARLTGICLI